MRSPPTSSTILVLGADGYLGWPTCMHFAARGHRVVGVDNYVRRQWEIEHGVGPLVPVAPLHQRAEIWSRLTGKPVEARVGDLQSYHFVSSLLAEVRPDAIIHYAEQKSAPYSMHSRDAAVTTQVNNVVGTLNLLFAMKQHVPGAHLVKLGTMGEYGVPNIDIEEGYITIEHNGRSDTLPFPKVPNSFYHLSKVHDSHNIHFACRAWGLAATDLNQGVVYGIETDEMRVDPRLNTTLLYDAVFGTVLNRFIVQACAGLPLTIYGDGGQTRGFLDLRDTLQCVELAVANPAPAGELRVYNQFTEQFSVEDLASRVAAAGQRRGLGVDVCRIENPRVEPERHYYNARHQKLKDLGLVPHLLTDESLDSMLEIVRGAVANLDPQALLPRIRWDQPAG